MKKTPPYGIWNIFRGLELFYQVWKKNLRGKMIIALEASAHLTFTKYRWENAKSCMNKDNCGDHYKYVGSTDKSIIIPPSLPWRTTHTHIDEIRPFTLMHNLHNNTLFSPQKLHYTQYHL